ncbi:porin family protein [Pontibacter ruber]|uniref:Porin family protein n=1 Tax=Pontibacter ruber TaxID=1343895 RepID=A0ABW5D3J6_9BACT|nr:porin family protein [Pontibacter ruber]
MKKTLFLLIFTLATFVAAQAQVGIGIRAGANLSSFEGDDTDGLESMWGFHGGLTANVPITEDFFSVQPELLFSKKGAESEDDVVKYKLSYLDVPVLARINAGPVYFEGGPQVSFRIGGDIEVDDQNVDDDLDQFKATSLGYAFGVGLGSVPMGLSVGVRYNGDISKLNDNDNAADWRNSLFLFTVGYNITGRE